MVCIDQSSCSRSFLVATCGVKGVHHRCDSRVCVSGVHRVYACHVMGQQLCSEFTPVWHNGLWARLRNNSVISICINVAYNFSSLTNPTIVMLPPTSWLTPPSSSFSLLEPLTDLLMIIPLRSQSLLEHNPQSHALLHYATPGSLPVTSLFESLPFLILILLLYQ